MLTLHGRCYACDRLIRTRRAPCEVFTSDRQLVWVGSECYRKILAAGGSGYQPPLGGPRLFVTEPAGPAIN